jgi:hypothetical protein
MNAFMAQGIQQAAHHVRADKLVPGEHVEVDGQEWTLQAVRVKRDAVVLCCGGRWNPTVPRDQQVRVLRA